MYHRSHITKKEGSLRQRVTKKWFGITLPALSPHGACLLDRSTFYSLSSGQLHYNSYLDIRRAVITVIVDSDGVIMIGADLMI